MKKTLLILCLLTALGITTKSLAQAPVISDVVPSSAKPGDVVSLTGTNFNETATNNIVFFGATKATVTAATATSLTVTVPTGATYAPISVLNTGTSFSTYSKTNFSPTYSPAKSTIVAGDFQTKQDFTTATSPNSVAIGDLDGDGKPDLVVANYGSNTISVYRNTSTDGSIGTGSFATKVDFTTGTQPYAIAIGDLDGDGKLDLAVANYGLNTVSVLRNTSTSGQIDQFSFVEKLDLTTGNSPSSVAIGDLDGDGKPDLAVINQGSNTVSVFRNTITSGQFNSASFATNIDFATGTTPVSVAIGDLDGDGKLDLAVANQGANNVSVFQNTSTTGSISLGSFAEKVDFTTGTSPSSVAIGDLNADGKPDLAVANKGSNSVSVFRNNNTTALITSGSFAAKVDLATGTGTSPSSITIGDMNGDGKPDLAVANRGSKSIFVWRNNSTNGNIVTGSFTPRVNATTGDEPNSVAIGDLDGDGKPDLAVANYNSSSLSVIRNANNNTDLSDLSTTAGTISPTFAATTLNYTASVDNATTSITVTPTAVDATATLSIRINNGSYTAITSGNPSAALALNIGSNAINVLVTPQNSVTRTYTITVTRAPNTLDNIGLNNSTASPAAFSVRLLSSTYSGAALRIRRSSDNATQDIGFIGGNLDTVALKTFVGTNDGFVTTWYDQSGHGRNATQTNVNLQPQMVVAGVIQRKSNVPSIYFNLKKLSTISFASAYVIGYTFLIQGAIKTDTQYPTFGAKTRSNISSPIDTYADKLFTGNGTTTTYTTLFTPIAVAAGFSQWTFVSSTTQSNAYINGNPNAEPLSVSTYSDNNTTSVILGSRTDGVTQLNGWISEFVTIGSALGTTDRQTAEASQIAYFQNNNADLTALTISSGTLSPTFDPATTAYTATVDNSTTAITVTPTLAQANATITVNVNGGNFVAINSANSTESLALNEGENPIIVRVAAQDGTTVKQYTITVTKLAVLPVSFTGFAAKLEKSGTVGLTWSTSSEINNSHFEVARSTDGISFAFLGKVNGNGSSTQRNSYSFNDTKPVNGQNYYKLVQVDVNGTQKELGIRDINVKIGEKATVTVYPNPSSNMIKVSFSGGIYHEAHLSDLTGKILMHKSINTKDNALSFDLSGFPTANYILTLVGTQTSISKQIIKK